MPNLTLVNEEEDPVGRDRAVGEENRIELDIGTTKIEHPGQTGKVNQLSPLLTFVCCKLGRITFFNYDFGPVVDPIKIHKLRTRKKLVRFVSKLKIYSFWKRSGFLRIRDLRIFIASTTEANYNLLFVSNSGTKNNRIELIKYFLFIKQNNAENNYLV